MARLTPLLFGIRAQRMREQNSRGQAMTPKRLGRAACASAVLVSSFVGLTTSATAQSMSGSTDPFGGRVVETSDLPTVFTTSTIPLSPATLPGSPATIVVETSAPRKKTTRKKSTRKKRVKTTVATPPTEKPTETSETVLKSESTVTTIEIRLLPTETKAATPATKSKRNKTTTASSADDTKPKADDTKPEATPSTLMAGKVNDAIPESTWAALRKCESGGNYKINTGNGYYGAYQFAVTTWRRLGYSGYPHEAAPEVQDEAARRLQAKAGWGQWPACSRKLGLR